MLLCSIETSLKLFPGFFQSTGVKEDDANHLVNTTRNDAIEQFALEIRVFEEEQNSLSICLQDSLKYYYDYRGLAFAYDWLRLKNVDVNHTISHQPKRQNLDFGASTHPGYNTAAIQARPYIKDLHQSYMRNLPTNGRR